jgi:hypothetical protein
MNDNVFWFLLVICVIAGADAAFRILYPRVKTALGRRNETEGTSDTKALTWLRAVEPDIDDADLNTRLKLVEALRIVNNKWSREVLQLAYAEESDPAIRTEIYDALHHLGGGGDAPETSEATV